MSVQVERLEHNMAKLTIEVEAKEFDAAMKRAYNKQKSSFTLPGFRKGKIPMNVIEKTYGAGIFYEDAANDVMQSSYPAAVEESGLDIVSRPEVDITQIGKGQNMIYTAVVAVKPEVTLGQYKGLAVDKESTEVSDEEIQEELKKAQEKNSREVEITDRPVQDGDMIRLSYAGTIDGVPFDGGTAENQNLKIGSHSFIDTFEDQLVGLNIGDTKDVEVTFPEEYHAKELAGKPAVFHVEILGIKEKQLDELNDDFAADYTDFDTLEEYKADIRSKLTADKEKEAKDKMQNDLIRQAIENAEMDIPEAMIDSEVDQMVEEFKQRVSYQGLSFEQYLQFTGSDIDTLKDNMRPQAEDRVKGSLVLEAIVEAEGITASDDDLQSEYDRMAGMYQMEAGLIASYLGEVEKENMRKNLAVQKAADFLLEQAEITEAAEELEFEEE